MRRQTVQPSDIHFRSLHLSPVHQVQQKCFVAGSALDDDNAFAEHPLQPRKCFPTVLSIGNDLGDHGIELRGDGIAYRHTGVNAHPGAGRKPEPLNRPGGRCETVFRIFGVQPHFNRVTSCPGRFSFQASAASDVNLQLDEVATGRALGHRMFDLQPGIHLHEGEAVAFRLVQEFDSPGVVISRHLAQAHRRLA